MTTTANTQKNNKKYKFQYFAEHAVVQKTVDFIIYCISPLLNRSATICFNIISEHNKEYEYFSL